MTPRTGNAGSLIIGATTCAIRTFAKADNVTFEDTENSETDVDANGVVYQEKMATKKGLTFTIGLDWDSDQNIHGDPPNLNGGAQITDVQIHVGASGGFYDCPIMNVESCNVTGTVGGKISADAVLSTQGSFSLPLAA